MVARIRSCISLYFGLMLVSLKTHLTYRTDLFVSLVSTLTIDLFGLLFVLVLFENINSLGGWNGWEVAVVFAFNSLAFGLANNLANGAWWINVVAYSGELTHLLIRPSNPLLTLLAYRVALFTAGNVISSGAVLVLAWAMLGLPVSLVSVGGVAILLCGGVVIWSSVLVGFGSLGLWSLTPHSNLVFAGSQLSEISRYPIHVFPLAVQFIVTWIFPVAFASFVPATILLGKGSAIWIGIWPVIVVLAPIVSYGIWTFGLRRYEGPGH